MIIRVNGVSYDIVDALGGSALGDLLVLKLKTKTPDFKGVTVPFIQKCFADLGKKSEEAEAGGVEFNPLDLLGDDDFLYSMIGLVFLAKRAAGEEVTVDEVKTTKFSDIQLESDEDDEEEADPKAPSAGVDGEPAA